MPSKGVRIGKEVLVKVPDAWLDSLDKKAKELDTSRSQLIREALKEAYGDWLPEAHYGRTKDGRLPRVGNRRITLVW